MLSQTPRRNDKENKRFQFSHIQKIGSGNNRFNRAGEEEAAPHFFCDGWGRCRCGGAAIDFLVHRRRGSKEAGIRSGLNYSIVTNVRVLISCPIKVIFSLRQLLFKTSNRKDD